MHPRKQLRADVLAILDAAEIGIPLHDMRARDLLKGESEAVIIYTPSESLRRGDAGGEMRSGAPVKRTTTLEILIVVEGAGDGAAAADRADDVARRIELALNAAGPQLAPASYDTVFVTESKIRCVSTLTYTVEIFDEMEN